MKQDYITGKKSEKYDFTTITKKAALKLLEDIDGELRTDTPNGHDLGVDIAKLLRFFTPNPTSKQITEDDEKWVLQAARKKDGTRECLESAYINEEANDLVCTDGRILLISGSYTKHSSGGLLLNGDHISEAERDEKYGAFPDYKRVIPAKSTERPGLIWEVGRLTGKNATRETMIDGITTRIKETYYQQAIAGMKKPQFFMGDALSPLLIIDDETNRTAVIMPIRAY